MNAIRRIRFHTLALLACAAISCDGQHAAPAQRARAPEKADSADAPARSAAVQTAAPVAQTTSAPPSFIVQGRVLYRDDGGVRTPLLALDSAHAPRNVAVAPAQWQPAPGSVFGVSATSFRHIAPAPRADRVAWETAGAVHDLLGVVPASGGDIVVLDFYFDSSARELSWAPNGRYLAAIYDSPSGVAELRVYDVVAAKRLELQWSKDCGPNNGCAVSALHWTAPATVEVATTTGRYRADVSKLPSAAH